MITEGSSEALLGKVSVVTKTTSKTIVSNHVP
jgi:hypothetical protein